MTTINIAEATKKALEEDLYISRDSEENEWKYIKIKPTNSDGGCLIYQTKAGEENMKEKVAPGKRWQPYARELTADDWQVTE